jgi:predicted permease
MHRLARLVVRLFATLVPRSYRAQWREEWLAEIASNVNLGCRFPRKRHPRSFSRALGAPIDALLLRVDALRASARTLRAGLRSDFRQTWRALVRTPRHVATVVLCLVVGITASVAVFSIVNSLLYGEIPGIERRKEMVRLFVSHGMTQGAEGIGREGMVSAGPLSRSDVEVLVNTPDPAFLGWAAEGDMRFAVSFRGQASGVVGTFVSPQYFAILGTQPSLGRLLAPHDDVAGAPPAAVIGYHLWRERFGAAPDVIGQPLLVGTKTYTIVGITPPRFTGMQPTDFAASPLTSTQLWLPMRDADTWPGAPGLKSAWLSVRGRLAPGFTMADAKVRLQAAAARLEAAYPVDRTQASFVLSNYGFGPGDTPLDVLIIISLFLSVPLSVLAIACANVANLQLARATERARELAVRLAIGASRGQIVRLLCLEALMLSIAATAAGWAASAAMLDALRDLFPLTITLALDRKVLAFTLTLAAGVTMLSGLAPAWIVVRRSMATGLQQSERAGGLAHARLRNGLVIVQIAASLILLIIAGLFTQSVRAMIASAPPSYKEQLVANFDLRTVSYGPADRTRFYEELRGRLVADPRVRAVAAEQFTGFRYRRVGGEPAAERGYSDGGFVTTGWAETTDRRLVAGRWITPDDGLDAALVSERFAQTIGVGESIELWTSADAPSRIVRIVGVVAGVRRRADIVNPDAAIYALMPKTMPSWFTVRVRTTDPGSMIDGFRQILRSVEPRLPWEQIEPAEAGYLRDVIGIRYLAMSVGGFGTVAMLLAAAGLFAVTAYVVSLRTREIGIRVAVGAGRADVIRLVLRQSLRLATMGALVGVAAAVPLAVALQAAFVGASPLDPLAVVPPVILMLLVATAAAAIPARRAASIDPVRALRAD